jgi:hypothetical protein
MKHVFMYANLAKNGRVEYDPKTGECKVFKAKETVKDPDVTVFEQLKKFVAKYPNDNFTFILNRNLSVPVFQAMKVINFLVLKKFTEDDTETVEVYAENLKNAGIDLNAVNIQDPESVKNMVKAAMHNEWLNPEALDYMLDLFMNTEHKFLNIDTIIEEPREGVTLSAVSKNVRELALELVNTTCAIPMVTRVELEDDLDEEEVTA